jgi:hypothetical protein
MADLGYLNMFAHDIQKMASFYADLFRLEEIRESRSPIFRGLSDRPPLKWSDLRYVFDSQEGHDGKEALQG